MINIAPSILAADPLRMGEEVQRLSDAGCDWIHVDVMDGHFVPNLAFSPATVAALRKRWPSLPLDVHLMLRRPGDFLDAFQRAGATGITVHQEAEDPEGCLRRIRAAGLRAGIALKPATPAETLRELLPLCDLVLVMTVEPGFGGQALDERMLDKIRAVRAMGWKGLLQSDGGITPANLPSLIDAGLDTAVMGTALFGARDPAEAIRGIRRMAP